LDKYGGLCHIISSLIQLPSEVNVIISKSKIHSKNRFQYYKTTNRRLYDREYKTFTASGFFDAIYFNERGELAEGSISNIFIYKNDVISTPPINAGILPGVYRKYLLKNDAGIRERRLYLAELLEADKIVLTNSVRGEVTVNKLFLDENEFIEFQM
jgi:para-aminobenzoate synthetase/4-amino-4-deoxychorismate lyase